MGYTLPDRKAKDWDLSLQTVFDQVFADYQSAGTGTAKMRVGTAAERAAYSTPYDGLMWSETDTGLIYQYYSSAWHQIGLPVAGAANAGMGAVVKSDGSGWEPGAPPPAMIQLQNWQTDPDEYTVTIQDAADTDGNGADNFYKYVMPAGSFSMMYTQVLIPFSGFDLRFILPYRMSSSVSGTVIFWIKYKAISAGDVMAEMANHAAFDAIDDGDDSITHTPSATADTFNLIDSDDLKIPSSAYAAGDILFIELYRASGGTHTGDAEIADCIQLKPVVP